MPRWSAHSKAFCSVLSPTFYCVSSSCLCCFCSLIPFYISVTAAHLSFRSPLPLFHQHHLVNPTTQCREKPSFILLDSSDSHPAQYLSAMAFSSHEDEDDGQDEILISTMRSLDLAHKAKRAGSYTWDHEKLDLSTDSNSTSMDTTSFYHSKTVFSTSNSIESLHQYHQQHNPQQQPNRPTTPSELLNENLALVQKNAIAQQEVISVRNIQARLENQIFELDQDLAEARKESQRLLRAKKDFDRQQEQSSAAFERDRSLWAEREAELLRSLKFATRPLVVQAPNKERSDSTIESAQDMIPPQIQQQISENNAAHARALRGQEQLVIELRKQILNINQDLIDRQRSFSLREKELQSEITQAQELNRSLMEENESYQMLLHEKSMNGEFMQTSIMKSTGYNDDPTGTPVAQGTNGSINLADELGLFFGRSPASVSVSDRTNEELASENKALKESNTALGVYISKILSRIMENPHLQAILAADYSPRRASVPESPPVVISHVNRSNGNINGSESDNGQKEKEKPKPEGRVRSRSLFSGFSRSKPMVESKVSNGGSNRSSSDDDAASATSTQLTSFQEGHAIEDSPRTSYSSTEFAIVSNDRPRPTEYEQLTTFDQPFSRKQLQRQSTLGSSAGHERHQRRQTIGGPSGVASCNTGGHGRYGSESSALAPVQSRRSILLKSKNSLSVLAPMPEAQSPEVPAIPEQHSKGADSMDSIRSPTLSISISEVSTASGISSTTNTAPPSATPPTTPIVAENPGTWRKAIRRMSLFGGSSNNTLEPATPKAEDTQSTPELTVESVDGEASSL